MSNESSEHVSDDGGEGEPLTVAQAFAVLDLAPPADAERVRAAYRRLAFELHPDRNQGSAESFARFKRLTRAYRLLEEKLQVDGDLAVGGAAGPCARCGQYAVLTVGLDRKQYCRDCLLSARGKRALPAPAAVVAGCGSIIVALVVAVANLATYASTGETVYAAAALVCGVLASAALACTCVWIAHTARRR